MGSNGRHMPDDHRLSARELPDLSERLRFSGAAVVVAAAPVDPGRDALAGPEVVGRPVRDCPPARRNEGSNHHQAEGPPAGGAPGSGCGAHAGESSIPTSETRGTRPSQGLTDARTDATACARSADLPAHRVSASHSRCLENRFGRFRPTGVQIPPSPLGGPGTRRTSRSRPSVFLGSATARDRLGPLETAFRNPLLTRELTRAPSAREHGGVFRVHSGVTPNGASGGAV